MLNVNKMTQALPEGSITLLIHGEGRDWLSIVAQAVQWNGPVSGMFLDNIFWMFWKNQFTLTPMFFWNVLTAAVLVAQSELSAIMKRIENLALDVRPRLGVHLVVTTDVPAVYPSNFLRNVALQEVTPHSENIREHSC